MVILQAVLTNIYNEHWHQYLLNQRAEYWLIQLRLQQMIGQLGLEHYLEIRQCSHLQDGRMAESPSNTYFLRVHQLQ